MDGVSNIFYAVVHDAINRISRKANAVGIYTLTLVSFIQTIHRAGIHPLILLQLCDPDPQILHHPLRSFYINSDPSKNLPGVRNLSSWE
jgi:hypothetical protein